MFTNKHRIPQIWQCQSSGVVGDVRFVKFGSVCGITQQLQGFRICMAAILNLGFWPYWHWATSLFGLVFRWVFSLSPKFGLSEVKPKSEVDFFVRTQSEGLSEKTELIRLVWSSDSVQINLHATDRLIPYRLTFAERKTTSLFRLVQTNRIAKKSPRRNNY